MNETEEKLLKVLFYSPSTSSTSVNNLYSTLKHRGVTKEQIKDFVNRQEVTQLYKKPIRIKSYFPISASYKNEIIQCDICDLSDIASANHNYKYLLVCIDVFSRFLYTFPMKNKDSNTVKDCMYDCIKETHPQIINCDNGSEFINKSFKKLMKDNNIKVHYVDVKEHHKLGIVDRVIRTLREKINKYFIMHNTMNYIDVLPSIVYNYNNSYHSSIKLKPNEVKSNDVKILSILNKKYNDALYSEQKFNIGDKVRYITNKKLFEKGSLAKWSKTLHTIISTTAHTYTLDNGQTKKYYELQKVDDVQHLDKPTTGPTREELRKQITNKRRFNKEGLSN